MTMFQEMLIVAAPFLVAAAAAGLGYDFGRIEENEKENN